MNKKAILENKQTFKWLNVAQFLGALNDNFFKLLLILCLIGIYGEESSARINAKAGMVFVIPFLLFAALAGVLADRVSKKKIIVSVKALEVFAMSFGAVGFLFKNEVFLYSALFLMALQGAFFAPSKFGIIPELVGKAGLSRANSQLVLLTYVAIIVGTILAPFLSEITAENYVLISLITIVVSVIGFAASLFIAQTPAAGSKERASLLFIGDIWRTLVDVRRDRYLLITVIATAYFLMIGGFVQINIIPYGIESLDLTKEKSVYLFLLAALGIGLGAFITGKISGRSVELGLVPVGAFGMTFSTIALGMVDPSIYGVAFLLFLLGLGAGMFIVPLEAFIQFRAPGDKLGKILAASSFLSWVGVLLATLLVVLFDWIGFSARQGFLIMGFMTFVLLVGSLKLLPDFFVRFIAVLLTHFCYRIKVSGQKNMPVGGPALLIGNHVAWIDPLLIMATQQRRIRFMMNRRMYDKWFLKPLMRLAGVIPVSFEDGPKQLIVAFQEARKALDRGYLVCVFAEGAMPRSGLMREFKRGFERILKGSDHPVIPFYLGGVWGSIFSYAYGMPLSRWPKKFPYPADIIFGKPLPPSVSAADVRYAVMELSNDYFENLKKERCSLGEIFIKTARLNRSRKAMTDTTGRSYTYSQALTASLLLAKRIKNKTKGYDKLGLLLPTSCVGALANVAVTLLGKIPINLNYTASAEAVQSSVDQSELKWVLTSKAFIEKLEEFPLPEGTVFVEDLLGNISFTDKLAASLKARFFPRRLLLGAQFFNADDVASIIFSSGSTGTPKGIMLSHHNIQSNIEAFRMVLKPSADYNLCGALPFFHSFGFTVTIWFPFLSGFSVSYHTNPLEGAKIAEVVRENQSTILITTPTFLMNYIRRAKPEDFESLKWVIVGAEKLKKRIADSFQEKFGLRPLEGYGATELSPVAASNIPDVDIDNVYQVGTKEGSVGHPIPGIVVKVVDSDTGKMLPSDTPGLLMIKGPNVMRGYLGHPEKTAEVLSEGWYNTGDIAAIDVDGFITITDRLSRFSKIGGEMVPHTVIEEVYYNTLQTADRVLAVTSVPDDRKGEKLVVLYTQEAGQPEHFHQTLANSDLPNLWKPGNDEYYQVDSIPILGSGKLDILGLRQVALSAVESIS
ncbi:MAG: MFS transporter [Kiritimatiellae bacterium]|nr:MFS transporter [Kiritimatiellia bacterium]